MCYRRGSLVERTNKQTINQSVYILFLEIFIDFYGAEGEP